MGKIITRNPIPTVAPVTTGDLTTPAANVPSGNVVSPATPAFITHPRPQSSTAQENPNKRPNQRAPNKTRAEIAADAAHAAQQQADYANSGSPDQVNAAQNNATIAETARIEYESHVISDTDLLSIVRKLLSSDSLPNPLSAISQVAYNWRLFMMNDKDLFNVQGSKPNTIEALYETIDKKKQITIAETGVTSYNIKSVETRAIVGPSFENRNATVTKFTIMVVEPIGVGFLDVLKDSATALRIKNLQKCPYYLELKFKGYDEFTGAILTDALKDSGLKTTRWIWQVQLIDIDTHLDASGGTYTITAQVYNDGALDEDILAAPQSINTTGSTIREVLKSLSKNMTIGWKLRNGNDIVTYDFTMHKITNPSASIGQNVDPNDYPMMNITNGNAGGSIRENRLNPGSIGEINAQLSPGTKFTDIIDWIMVNNKFTLALGLDPKNKQKDALIFKVETDIEIEGYDTYSANYIKKIHVHIWPYYTQAILTGPEQKNAAKDSEFQKSMAKELLQRGFIRKHYDYIYTGLNTEVLEFDIKSNFKWNALLPKLFGQVSSYDSREPGVMVPTSLLNPSPSAETFRQAIAARKEKIEQLIVSADDAGRELSKQNEKVNIATQELNAARETFANPSTPQSQKDEAKKILDQKQKIHDDLVDKRNDISENSNKYIKQIRQLADLNEADRDVYSPIVLNSKQYAEDLINPDGTSHQLLSDYDYQLFNYNISFRQGYRDGVNQTGTGFGGNHGTARSTFGSLIDQLYQPSPSQLANIDISIRGDPYWIGTSNLHRQTFLRNDDPLAGTQNIIQNMPNFVAGDQTFLITFRYPVGIGEDGQPVFKTDDTFNGVYRATEVISTFADGTFKQKLHGLIIPLLKVAAAFGGYKTSRPSGNTGSESPTMSPTGVPVAGGVVQPAITTAQQQNNAAKFRDSLKAEAARQNITLSDANIDGIVSNAYRESSMAPNLYHPDDSGGQTGGLLQWHDVGNSGRYTNFTNYTNGVNPNNASIEQQAAFTIHELRTTEKPTYNALQTATTVAQSADIWITKYERPAKANTPALQSVNHRFIPTLYSSK